MTRIRFSPKIFIFIALDCEAKPLIKFLSLKKDNTRHPFQIYSDQDTVIVVTGVGKVSMAGAVAYTLALFPKRHMPVLLNIGIAGHQTWSVGDVRIATKIVDADSGKTFYPQLIGSNWPESSEIKTLSQPCAQYNDHCLRDMEASAFYEMAVRFSSGELIHCLKVISDNQDSSIENITAKLVTSWISNKISEIDRLIKHLSLIRLSIIPVKIEEYEEIVKHYHFTVSGQIKLKALLRRWNTLTTGSWLSSHYLDFPNAKKLLLKLESDINNLDVYL